MPIAVLMLKAPRPGLVKTRLAKDLGPEAACLAYRWMVEKQLQAIPSSWEIEVHFTPAEAAAEMQEWLQPLAKGLPLSFVPQSEGDLGQRLHHAATLAKMPAVFLGGDCPQIDDSLLQAVEAALHQDLAVLSLSTDGGYCLLGLPEYREGVFQKIAWSTEKTGRQQLDRLRESGHSVQTLAPLSDVDTLADWEAVPDRPRFSE
ncbi:MAG: TIGR04282 family arsenosugar biosynthesis glycosyltransferase [Verrucomicrobiota bacterium]